MDYSSYPGPQKQGWGGGRRGISKNNVLNFAVMVQESTDHHIHL